ncbi:hypothetical protein RIF29_33594 [Crotalaria pallida]|uniref:Uncharacterized protein n=1 Tax=Crotalaria pallida TaxID=3830 RepID=A0AAN9E7Z7_CROPI
MLRLDLGNGKNLDLEKCPRSKLRKQIIKYLGPKNKGSFHHSSFLAGGATLAAGRLEVEHGILKAISAYSGHYRPTDDSLKSFLSYLKKNGVQLEEVEICKARDDTDSYDDGKLGERDAASEVPSSAKMSEPGISKEAENTPSSNNEDPQPQSVVGPYQRTLSDGLRSPRAEVPKTAILQRINSKKGTKSYQLGHQLSRKWSTGAGPRIGCVADYPVELRVQALEILNLSPKLPPSPSLCLPLGGLESPATCPSPNST